MVIGQSVWFYACYVVFCCLLICTQFLMCCRVVQAVQFTVHSLCLTLTLPQTLVLKNFLLRVIITSKKNMSAKLSILLYGGWNGTKAMHTTWRERSYMVHKIVVLCLGALYVLVIEPILVLNLLRESGPIQLARAGYRTTCRSVAESLPHCKCKCKCQFI